MKPLETFGLLATVGAVALLAGSLVMGLKAETRAEETPSILAATEEPRERVRVEVLNAAGIPGLARAATRELRERRFDVVYFGNASRFGPDSSWVIDRVGHPEEAWRVAEALRIPRVRLEPDSTLYLDVTVVLGRDWPGAETARRPLPLRRP